MTSDTTFRIRPAGRHLLTIGRNLIKDHAAAIVELVKNSFDADADQVLVKFSLTNSKLTIVVEDDGHGMTRDVVVGHWLVPSTPDKLTRRKSPSGRQLQGRKGIGRYAASLLGDSLLLETTTAKAKTTVVLQWSDFEAAQFLSDVEILVETETTSDRNGTRVTIIGDETQIEEWTTEAFEKLRFELRKLVSPLQRSDTDQRRAFSIRLQTESFPKEQPQNSTEDIKPFPLFDLYDYRISGTITKTGSGTFVFHNQKIKSAGPEPFGAEFSETLCGDLEFDIRVFERDADAIDQLLKRGVADGRESFMGKLEVKRLLNQYNGIGVYRNGFRIRPLGDSGFDWLQLSSRRVQNPSMRLGTNQVIGFVTIQAEEVSGLEEKSARDGLRENLAFAKLRELTLAVLHECETRRFLYRTKAKHGRQAGAIESTLQKLFDFGELRQGIERQLKESRVPNEQQAHILETISKEEARKGQLFEEIRRAIAIYQGQATLGKIISVVLHEGRRPLNFFKNEVPNLEFWATGLKEAFSVIYLDRVVRIAGRFGQNAASLVELFNRLDPLAAGTRGPKGSFSLLSAIEDSFAVFEHQLQALAIQWNVSGTLDAKIVGWSQDLITTFVNLIDNSVFWMSQTEGGLRQINVVVESSSSGQLVVDYYDSGPGIAPDLLESNVIFDPEFSTKPKGTGLGLAIAGEACRRNSLEIRAIESSAGAHFRIASVIHEGAANEYQDHGR